MSAHLLIEHFHLLAAAPNGVQKLRELILNLAVRGKLVPQDSQDEPVSELLKRIQAEKSRLVTEGKIKSPSLPLLQRGKTNAATSSIPSTPPFAKGGLGGIPDKEKPYELPQGWEWSRLAAIALINPRNAAEDMTEASFVPMSMINTRFEGSHDQETRKWGEIKQGFTHFAKGDIGVAKITPCFENSKACVFSGLTNGIGAGTTELHIIRPISETLAPRYVLAYLKSPMFLQVGEGRMTGTAGQKRLPKEFVEANPFPLPPLQEQHRIVAKVDELMALCDRMEAEQADAETTHATLVQALLSTLTSSAILPEPVEGHSETDSVHASTSSARTESITANWQRLSQHFDTLFTTEASLDALKQTVLQLAVMGKLVPQDPKDEPASELLKRIAAEKARLVAEGKIRKDKPLAAVCDGEKPFELPVGWEWVRLGVLAEMITSGSRDWAQHYSGQGAIFVRMGNLSRGSYQLRLNNIQRVHPPGDGEGTRTKLAEGDVLISITGEVGLLGLIPPNFGDAYINQHTCLVRLAAPMAGRFIPELLRSPLALEQFNAPQRGIKNSFRLTDVTEFVLALPPLPEQHRIVAKVDELMQVCDVLTEKLAASRQLAQRLVETLTEQAVRAGKGVSSGVNAPILAQEL